MISEGLRNKHTKKRNNKTQLIEGNSPTSPAVHQWSHRPDSHQNPEEKSDTEELLRPQCPLADLAMDKNYALASYNGLKNIPHSYHYKPQFVKGHKDAVMFDIVV